jgi:hypothetical protein
MGLFGRAPAPRAAPGGALPNGRNNTGSGAGAPRNALSEAISLGRSHKRVVPPGFACPFPSPPRVVPAEARRRTLELAAGLRGGRHDARRRQGRAKSTKPGRAEVAAVLPAAGTGRRPRSTREGMRKRGRRYQPSSDLAGACGSKPPASSWEGCRHRLHLVPTTTRERER